MKRHSIIRTLIPPMLAAMLAGAALAGETPATGSPAPAGKATPSGSQAVTPPTPAEKNAMPAHQTPKPEKVDLNTATKAQLMTLPGIGEAAADKIVAARPFKTKSELLSKGLVNKAQYDKVASHVVAKEAKASKH